MMALPLQITLIVVSVCFVIVVFYNVNKRRLSMKYSLLWLLLALVMLVMAVFPQAVAWISPLVGIETPSNFVFLVALVLLLAICFTLTVIVSKQALKIQTLIQWMAINQHLEEERRQEERVGED